MTPVQIIAPDKRFKFQLQPLSTTVSSSEKSIGCDPISYIDLSDPEILNIIWSMDYVSVSSQNWDVKNGKLTPTFTGLETCAMITLELSYVYVVGGSINAVIQLFSSQLNNAITSYTVANGWNETIVVSIDILPCTLLSAAGIGDSWWIDLSEVNGIFKITSISALIIPTTSTVIVQ